MARTKAEEERFFLFLICNVKIMLLVFIRGLFVKLSNTRPSNNNTFLIFNFKVHHSKFFFSDFNSTCTCSLCTILWREQCQRLKFVDG